MKLTNGMKNYTFDKAREFAIKFCDKNFSIYEEDIVKSLISKNILTKFDLSSGLLNINKEQYRGHLIITFLRIVIIKYSN